MFNIVFFEDTIPTDRNPKKIGDSNLSTLKNGTKMFLNCSEITSYNSDLSSLTNAKDMFSGCSNLKSFTSDLSNVTNGDGTFYQCSNLTTFSTNLSNLSTGQAMFYYCTKLESFNVDLTNLCDGSSMFRGCEKLTSFTSDLFSLTDGEYMFNNCKNLTTFTSSLPSLVCGTDMFKNNRLSPMSVIYIIDSIRNVAAEKKLYEDGIRSYVTKNDETGNYSASRGFMSDGSYVYEKDGKIEKISATKVGKLTLGIDVINESETLEEQLQSFAEEASFDSWAELQEMFVEKGWSVTFEYCGISQNYKYKGCKTVNDVKAVDPNYQTTDIVNGVWSERLDDLENGTEMFSYSNLAEISSNLSTLTIGSSMFKDTNLTYFDIDLPNLDNGTEMFRGCTNLELFNSDLSSLSDGTFMFSNCYNLESFNSDLSSLKNGYYMFEWCPQLDSFNSDLSSLTDGESMFTNCSNLTTFNSDLSSLTSGGSMFHGCTNLASFTSDLSSLTNGYYMFYDCKLNTASVQNIADTINTYNGTINIDIANSTPNEQEKAEFNTIASKGWTIYSNGNTYSSTSPAAITTLDENGEEITTPIPYYAKPVPATEESASYTDSEGNYYNILGAQFIYGDNLETYGMFTCEEDAAANMRLTKYVKEVEEK